MERDVDGRLVGEDTGKHGAEAIGRLEPLRPDMRVNRSSYLQVQPWRPPSCLRTKHNYPRSAETNQHGQYTSASATSPNLSVAHPLREQ